MAPRETFRPRLKPRRFISIFAGWASGAIGPAPKRIAGVSENWPLRRSGLVWRDTVPCRLEDTAFTFADLAKTDGGFDRGSRRRLQASESVAEKPGSVYEHLS